MKTTAGSHVNMSKRLTSTNKVIAAAISIIVAISLVAGFFATATEAKAAGIMDSAVLKSEIVVDSEGNVIENNLVVNNATAKDTIVKSITAPEGLDSWTTSIEGTQVATGQELDSEWNGVKVSQDVLDKLNSNGGKVDLTFDSVLSFDAEFEVDTQDVIYKSAQWTPDAVSNDGLLEDTDFEIVYGENVNAGEGTITIQGTGKYVGEETFDFKINRKEVTAKEGITANPKIYDSNRIATTDTTGAVLDGYIEGDSLGVSADGTFDTKNVGVGKEVALSNLALTGDDKDNYELTEVGNQETTNADITAKEIKVVSGVVASNKVYNGNLKATLDVTNAAFDAVYSGDTVHLQSADGTFGSKTVGDNKAVTLSNFVLKDADKDNYCVAETGNQQPTANITKKPVTVSGVKASNKIYNQKTNATLDWSAASLSTLETGDSVSLSNVVGTFANKNVGTNKTVTLSGFELQGDDSGNYEVASTGNTNPTASITAKEIAIEGVTIKDRAYKANDKTAEINSKGSIKSGEVFSGDDLSIDTVTCGQYADENAADDKEISVTITFKGTDKDNYAPNAASKKTTGDVLTLVKFDTNCSQTINDTSAHVGAKLTDTYSSQLTARTGLTADGWYKNGACMTDSKWNFSSDTVSGNTLTLYENWTVTSDASGNQSFWIGPAYNYISAGNNETARTTSNDASSTQNARYNYVSEETNVLKSSAEIKSDISKLRTGTTAEKTKIKAEYQEYMTSDKYHLYTKVSNGSGKDAYAEFRIVEVSGDSGHGLYLGGNDGSVITFMATHVVATCYTSNYNTGGNDGGWGGSVNLIRPALQEGGTIYNYFNSGFLDSIRKVTKEYNTGGRSNSQTATPSSSVDALWIASYKELVGNASGIPGTYPNTEGTQYAWFANRTIYASGLNNMFLYKTRSGSQSYWWLRTPWVSDRGDAFSLNLAINKLGYFTEVNTQNPEGIVPAFCM